MRLEILLSVPKRSLCYCELRWAWLSRRFCLLSVPKRSLCYCELPELAAIEWRGVLSVPKRSLCYCETPSNVLTLSTGRLSVPKRSLCYCELIPSLSMGQQASSQSQNVRCVTARRCCSRRSFVRRLTLSPKTFVVLLRGQLLLVKQYPRHLLHSASTQSALCQLDTHGRPGDGRQGSCLATRPRLA